VQMVTVQLAGLTMRCTQPLLHHLACVPIASALGLHGRLLMSVLPSLLIVARPLSSGHNPHKVVSGVWVSNVD
jgi:hypothetical protein